MTISRSVPWSRYPRTSHPHAYYCKDCNAVRYMREKAASIRPCSKCNGEMRLLNGKARGQEVFKRRR